MTLLPPWVRPQWIENDSGVLMPDRRAIYITSDDSSVALTFTDLDNEEDPAGVGSTQVDLSASGGGGGGLRIGELGWNDQAPDDVTTIPVGADRLPTNQTIAQPPNFLDGNGNILVPGLYRAFLTIRLNNTGVAGQYLSLNGPFDLDISIPCDAIAAMANDAGEAYNSDGDVVCLLQADVNHGAPGFNWLVTLPSSATGWGFEVLPFLLQLAY